MVDFSKYVVTVRQAERDLMTLAKEENCALRFRLFGVDLGEYGYGLHELDMDHPSFEDEKDCIWEEFEASYDVCVNNQGSRDCLFIALKDKGLDRFQAVDVVITDHSFSVKESP